MAGLVPTLFAKIFTGTSEKEILYSFLAMRALCAGVCQANVDYIRLFGAPPIYDAGVRYIPEFSSENWLTVPYIIANGGGDCEDLACWRAAELRLKGVDAKPDIRARQMSNGAWRAHCIVRLPDGTIEDPSEKLGMPKGGLPETHDMQSFMSKMLPR
ncbi:MAG: hypothetical protein ACRDL7_08335 [Gaiellaceae bacterium]